MMFGERALRRARSEAFLDLDILRDRSAFIPHALMADFLLAVEDATGEPDVALFMVPHLSVLNYGAWGHYLLGSETLAGALRRGMEASRLQSSSDTLAVTFHDSLARISYPNAAFGMEGYTQVAIGVVAALASLCREYLPASWQPVEVAFDIPRPALAAAYEARFGCPVRFGAAAPSVCLTLHDLQARRPPRAADRALTFEDVARSRTAIARAELSCVVAEEIRVQLLAGEISIEHTAETLATSVRTLQRNLHVAGTSFRDLANGVRIDRARSLLRETATSITDIALRLGYSAPNHFARAFLNATGESPRAYRARRSPARQPRAPTTH